MGSRIDIDDTLVIERYDKLKNLKKVAKSFNVSLRPIVRILKKNNIELTNRRYDVNHSFFEVIDTEEKAYWLGFLFADGYIRERNTGLSLELKLAVKDREHIELFRETLKSTHIIKEGFNKVKYKNGYSQSHMLHLAIYSSDLVKSIKTKGIHSRKTFTITKPEIAKSLIPHFIRGYFDGDGSFSFNIIKKTNKTNFACASEEFREFLISELLENGIKLSYYGGITMFIQNKMDNLKFYNYIYKNATIYLKRKKEKYEEFRGYYGYDN
jgi:intein-encoded DNA endonuclease-like protein